jgi:hypothetical protein
MNMNNYLANSDDLSNLQLLKDLLNHHFEEFFSEVGISIEDHLILNACVVIEYLIYYHGNTRRMQEKLRYRFPEPILSILERKFQKENAFLAAASQRMIEKDTEIAKIKIGKWGTDQQNFSLRAENDRLQKMIDQQNLVLRKLQDRLDCVSRYNTLVLSRKMRTHQLYKTAFQSQFCTIMGKFKKILNVLVFSN